MLPAAIALVTVLEGKGRFTVDGKPYILDEGESIVMPAGIPHAVFGEERFKICSRSFSDDPAGSFKNSLISEKTSPLEGRGGFADFIKFMILSLCHIRPFRRFRHIPDQCRFQRSFSVYPDGRRPWLCRNRPSRQRLYRYMCFRR